MGIREAMLHTAPPWLADGEGARLLFTIGTMLDADVTWTEHGMRARWPSYKTDDVLSALGRDRVIIRGAFEDADTYAERLTRWLDDWIYAGNPFAILRQLRAYLAPFEVPMRIVNNAGSWYTLNPDGSREFVLGLGNWTWDLFTYDEFPFILPPLWSRFWVILYPPAALWTRLPDIGDPDLWDGAIGNPGFTIGSTAKPEHVASIRQIVSTWKDEKSQCVSIVVSFDPSLFEPGDTTPPNPDGWYGNASRVVAGVRIPTRSSDAIYWPGTGGPVYSGL